MGAEVVKIEGHDGEPLRHSSSPAVGSPDGPGFLHLRWNRGKKSIGLDLKTDDGHALFRRLAAVADVVTEGLRPAVLARLVLGYATPATGNPRPLFIPRSPEGSRVVEDWPSQWKESWLTSNYKKKKKHTDL